jgi:hypothetical protein
MPSAEYYLKQAETASRLALTESDPAKMQALHLLVLEFFNKAEQVKAASTFTSHCREKRSKAAGLTVNLRISSVPPQPVL